MSGSSHFHNATVGAPTPKLAVLHKGSIATRMCEA